ncbi:chaperone protein DnaJ-like [Artemia franciscana]|uniref:Uncharacterized protein n=1 Tax=Artemia franciscana TaxID=6661 RepID=A0AA88L4J3_ARTSF|nr:hypothetical protein QYM36_005779 [Artemia franciscana]
METPWTILGLPKGASMTEIKTAYRKLALIHHPDKNPAGKEKFQEIQNAYSILIDPVKRRNYEPNQAGFGGFGSWNFQEFGDSPEEYESDSGFEFHGGGGNIFDFIFRSFRRCQCHGCQGGGFNYSDGSESDRSWKNDYGATDESSSEEEENDMFQSDEGSSDSGDSNHSESDLDESSNESEIEVVYEEKVNPKPSLKSNRKCEDLDIVINLTNEEIKKKRRLKVEFERRELCPQCSGSGIEGSRKKPLIDCSRCSASGYIFSFGRNEFFECPICEGYGKIPPRIRPGTECKKCSGQRTVLIPCSRTVSVPRGAVSGEKTKLGGQGHREPYSENGDLYIAIVFQAVPDNKENTTDKSDQKVGPSAKRKKSSKSEEFIKKTKGRGVSSPKKKQKKK